MGKEPTTLQQAIVEFSDQDNCREYVVPRRWAHGVICPTCGSEKVTYQPKHNRWQCTNRHPRRQFTLKTGTVMEDSPLGMDKWLTAMWLVASNRNGIHRGNFTVHSVSRKNQLGSCSIGFALPCRMNTTAANWAVRLRRMRALLAAKPGICTGGVKARKVTGTGGKDKTAVMGILERGGKIRTSVIPNRRKSALQSEVRKHVEAGSALFTDSLKSYEGLSEFQHQVVDHAVQYVDGNAHTNGCENFWSLLKRTLNGTYVSVEPFHLFRYLDEQTFRSNNCLPLSDGDRFSYLVRKVVGKRLTYAELTGKVSPPETIAC